MMANPFLSLEMSLQTVSVAFAAIVGYIGVAVMVYGALKAGFAFALCCIRRQSHLPEIRIDLGKHLALGLEFLVGKDIIHSIISPSWDDLGKLAVLVLLRTFVTFVLTWELKELEREVETERLHQKAVKLLKRKKR